MLRMSPLQKFWPLFTPRFNPVSQYFIAWN